MDSFLAQILDQPAWLIYLVVFVAVFVEDALFVGFVIPAETLAILGGVSASLGHTDVIIMAVGVVIMAIIGDSVGYEVGHHYGDRIFGIRLLRSRQAQLDRARGFLRERGGTAVFLGRWTAFFRAVMPALAGASKMPYRTFLPWNAIGGLTWGVAVVTAGYLAGRSYKQVATWLGEGAAAVVAIVVLVALIGWHFRRRREAGAATAAPAVDTSSES